MECYWIRNTEASLAKLREASEGVALLPLGSIESHGPHLPVGSDSLVTEEVVARVVAAETVAVLPTVHYSFVGSARMRLGAIHIQSELLVKLVENICDEAARNGFTKVVLLHGHGGNVFLHKGLMLRALEKQKPYSLYSFSSGAFEAEPSLLELVESKETGHACEVETSDNMAAVPELVNLDALGDKTYPSQPGPDVAPALTPVYWVARHPELVVGEPQKATREKGEKFIQAKVKMIVECLRKIKKDTLVRETMQSYAAQTRSFSDLP